MAIAYHPETGLNVPQVAVWMVFLVIFLDTIGATISTPALPYYAQRFGCTNGQIGYLFGAWSATSTVFAPLMGRLADVVGRRTVLLMSLIGAGTAALAQGFAPNYWVLLGARAFSGVWAAVGSTAQVYMADACSPSALPTYLARLSAVPGLAMIFGPGLGGGLSKFGLNVPIIVDGCVSLFASTLVAMYLPESVAWLASKEKTKEKDEEDEATPLKARTVAAPTTTQREATAASLWLLCGSQLFNGITFSTIVSMLALSLDAKLGFDALEVGYVFVSLALVMVLSSVWITPRIQNKFGVHNSAVWATVITGIALLAFAEASTIVPVLLALMGARAAQSLRGASFGTIVTRTTTIETRGVTLARVQLFLNAGRLIGPVVSGHIADTDVIRLPWYLAAIASFISAVLLAATTRSHEPRPGAAPRGLLRGYTDIRGSDRELRDECPTDDDVKELGEYMADLLTRRHYQWVSRKEATHHMLEALLPELHTDSAGHIDDLDKLMKHADLLGAEFRHQ